MNITIERKKDINKDNLIAFVDVCINDEVIIKGCRVLKGNNGNFVSLPSKKDDKSGKYFDHVWFKTMELKKEFNDQVVSLVCGENTPQVSEELSSLDWEE